MSYNSKYTGQQVENLLDQVNNGTGGSTPDLSGYATKEELNGKVDKVDGKQLSTEDFTTLLKQKLDGLSNYDDTEIQEAVSKLRTDLDTLVSGDTTTAIKTFNEIIAFLDGISDTEDLSGIIASIEQQIEAKQERLVSGTNIKTINGESILGEGNIEIKGGGGVAYPRVDHSSDGTGIYEFVLTPNTFHVWGEVKELHLSFSEEIEGVMNEYRFQFTAGYSMPILSLPDNVRWAQGETVAIRKFHTYLISVINGLAHMLEFSDNVSVLPMTLYFNIGEITPPDTNPKGQDLYNELDKTDISEIEEGYLWVRPIEFETRIPVTLVEKGYWTGTDEFGRDVEAFGFLLSNEDGFRNLVLTGSGSIVYFCNITQ